MAPKRKRNKTQGGKEVKPGIQHIQDGPESKPTINMAKPQPPPTTIPDKEKRSLSPVEIKQESKRDEDGITGERELRSEGREGRVGTNTDIKSHGVSQPDQAMDVDDTASPVKSDITAYDHDDHRCPDDVLDHEAIKFEIAEAESKVAENDTEIAKMDARTARNDSQIARKRIDIAINSAEIFRKQAEILALVMENTGIMEGLVELSEENGTMAGRCAEMVGRNARMEIRNAIMGTILHIAKGDDTLAAMAKEGLGKARLTAQQLVQVREAMERIYKAGRRPSDEDVEDVLEKAKRLRAAV